MYDIVILTDKRYENPKQIDWYIDQILTEDKILHDELEKRGLKVHRKDWSDKEFNWSDTKYAIFRTTWDYFDHFDEFFEWIGRTKKKTKFINSAKIINWNIDKHYLKDLAEKGVNIPKTIFIEKGQKVSLKKIFQETRFKEAIIKPAISGAARHTYRITNMNYNEYEKIFQNLVKNECVLFQEFLNDILTNGEISLIMIGDDFTHAVRKVAKKGDFRVQDDHGGIVQDYIPNKEEISFAKSIIESCPYKPIYSRVDIIYDNKNSPSLSELELIEPELWFRNYPEAAAKLAKKIVDLF